MSNHPNVEKSSHPRVSKKLVTGTILVALMLVSQAAAGKGDGLSGK